MWKYYVAALLIFGFDQWTKRLVAERMVLGESIPLVDRWLYLTSHRNAGAAFGILQGQRWLFIVVTVAVVAVVLYTLWRMQQERLLCWALALILGGAVGNLLDRIRFGEVVDFIDVRIFGYHYPIFNVADSAVVVGGAMLAFVLWRGGRSAADGGAREVDVLPAEGEHSG